MADTVETLLDGPESLLPGDEVVTTGLGGITGVVARVYPGIWTVAVEMTDGRVESLSADEVVTVRREMGQVHPEIAAVLALHGIGR